MATDLGGEAATDTRDRTPMVKAEAVHKRFGSLEVLKGIDMEVLPARSVLLGASGSGKSTFLRCINHLEKINAGRLSVDGHLVGYRQEGDKLYELKEKEISKSRAEIGMVFQRFNLFPHMTALENVCEAPCQVKKVSKDAARTRPGSCWTRSAWPRRPTCTRPSCRAASNSGWPSPAPWPWTSS